MRFIVTGAQGKMGTRICSMIQEAPDLTLVAGIDLDGSLEHVLEQQQAKVDAIIDFTIAEAAADNTVIAAHAGIPIVIGTTGLNETQCAAILDASKRIPVLRSSNMSLGVNVLFDLVERAARALGLEYAIDIEETHHVHKKDRPSGTAKSLAHRALLGLGQDVKTIDLEEQCAWTREPGDHRVSLRSFRRGEVVGEHTITFTGKGETLTLSHHVASRDILAAGAVTAARWIVGKPAGIYGMEDVLGLK